MKKGKQHISERTLTELRNPSKTLFENEFLDAKTISINIDIVFARCHKKTGIPYYYQFSVLDTR